LNSMIVSISKDGSLFRNRIHLWLPGGDWLSFQDRRIIGLSRTGIQR